MTASRYDDAGLNAIRRLRDLESRLRVQEAKAGGQAERARIGLEIRNAAPDQPADDGQQDGLADIARQPFDENGARHLRAAKRRHAAVGRAARIRPTHRAAGQRIGIDIITPPLATSALRPRSRRSGVFGPTLRSHTSP